MRHQFATRLDGLRFVTAAALAVVGAVCIGSACRGASDAERPDSPMESPSIRESPEGKAEAPERAGAPSEVEHAASTPVEPQAPPPPPETHAVFDLIANRHLAHRQVQGGLLIEAGQPGFARYTHGNAARVWDLEETHEERAVALPVRTESTLFFPLTAEQAAAARVFGVDLYYRTARYRIEASHGETELGGFDLVEGWQQVAFDVPSGALAAGENTLTLAMPSDSTASGGRVRGALSRLFIGPAAPAWERIGPLATTAADGNPRLRLTPEEGLAWYGILPPGAHFAVGLDAPAGTPCEIRLTAANEAGETWLATADVASASSAVVPLEAPAGEVLRLDLAASPACPELALAHAELATPGPAPSVAAFEPPRNVVIWLIDTLRADRLRSINPNTRVIGPAFDRFAADGAVFTRAYVQGNESFASHAALFSGVYPETSRVLSSRDHLDDDYELIAELLGRAGLFSGGYSANGHIRATNGFEQGMRDFVNCLRDDYSYHADDMQRHAGNFIDEHGADPFFLYIGTVDTHVTYRSHEDILPLYDPEPYSGRFMRTVGGDELGMIKGGDIVVNDRDRVRIEAIYDDTITYGDRYFGFFMDDLQARGMLDQTLIIITSDHGDEFWEHGSVGHGHNVYQELVHVPLLMRYPGAIPAGTVVDEGVDTIDVIPTLAHLFGLEPHESTQGESLLPLIHGVGAEYPRPAFSQQYGHTFAMNLDRWKIIWRGRDERRLYDLTADPTEQTNVATTHPFALRFATDAMGLFMAYRREWRKADWGVASNLLPEFRPL